MVGPGLRPAAADDPQCAGFTGRLQRPVPQLAGLAHVPARADAGLALNVGYFRTWYGGQLVTNNEAVPASGYDTYCITAPTDSRLPGGGGNRIRGLYDIRPAFFGRVDNLVTQASNFGDGQKQVYNGVESHPERALRPGRTVLRRVERRSDGHRQRYINDNPSLTSPAFLNVVALPAGTLVPRNAEFCNVTPPWSAGTQVKFLAVYPLPWDIETSAIFQNSPGVPITASYVVTNPQVAAAIGRNLAACPAVGVCNATVRTELIAPNTQFEPRLTQVDMRVSRLFRLPGTTRVRGSLDVYNIFNASSVLAMVPTYGTSWLNAAQVLSARLLRVSAQLDF